MAAGVASVIVIAGLAWGVVAEAVQSPRRPAPQVTACAPVRTASQFNTMLANVTGWKAGDGGHTAMVDNGRRVWSFGDSLGSDGQLHHNALVTQNGMCAVATQSITEAIPNSACGDDPATPAEEGYCWGGPMTYDAATRILYMLSPKVHQLPGCTGAFCFAGDGAVLAMWNVPKNALPVWRGAVPVPDTDGINWTAGITTMFDGSLVVYGYSDDHDPWTFGWDIHAAVVSDYAALRHPEMWGVWTGIVVAATGGPETSFSVTPEAGGYTLTSTADGGLGHVVTEWRSETPLGPWTTTAIADYPDTADHYWYLPLRIAGTNLHVISQNWPHRPLGDIPAHPADFRVVVF